MNVLDQYNLPIQGLQSKEYELDFKVNKSFFDCFEKSLVKDGIFDVKVILDKKFDHAEMNVEISGFMKSICDRCLANIDLPISSEHKLYLKKSELIEKDEILDEEVIVYTKDDPFINISQYIYELILVSVPVARVYDCDLEENPPCDFKVLDKLEEGQEIANENKSSIWDNLKNLDISN